MLLRNFVVSAAMYSSTNASYKVRDTKNEVISSYYLNHMYMTTTSGANYSETGITLNNNSLYTGIVVGTGSTAPTYNDYKMESAVDPNIVSYTSNSLTFPPINTNSQITDPMVVTFTQNITNNSGNDITIKEVGLFKGTGSTSCASVLITRDVISPVTITPNETKTFIVTMDFAQMSTSASAN